MNNCLVLLDETLYKHKKILSRYWATPRAGIFFFYINTELENNTSP